MSKKKICFFNSNIAWGGGEKWHYDMALRMNRAGFKVFVIAGKKSDLSIRLKETAVPLKTAGISNLSFLNPIKILYIYNLLKREQINTIILNLSEDFKVAGIAAKLAGVKHIIYRRGSAIPIKNNLLNRLLFKYILTDIIANSFRTKHTILQNNSSLFPEERINVIYNGIPLEKVDSTESNPFYERRPGEVILGNAGRLVAQKGQKHLIEIAKRLKERNLKFKLLIAGDGKCLDSLKQLVLKYDVFNEVIFLGFVKDIPRFMETIDIFLLPSLWEGFGYVIVEAMAAHKPVIAFDVSSNPEIIQDGQTGYLIKEMDIDAFTEKIEFLSQNKSLRREMGLEGRKRAEEFFDVETTYRKLTEFISSQQ
jgi:glycosyltransferase involved in cell wall biosynthesis